MFPEAQVKGCFFHLSQAIYRKVQGEGLQQIYSNDEEFALKARMFAALAFVPADNVIEAFEQLAADLPDELIPIADYFEDTYLGSVRRGQRRPPRFEPTMWSVYDRVNEDLPRTNNAVEGWHSAFAANAGGHHINFWRFLEVLKREEALASVIFAHVLQGRDPPNPRPVYAALKQRVINLVESFHERPILQYLRGIAYNFTW